MTRHGLLTSKKRAFPSFPRADNAALVSYENGKSGDGIKITVEIESADGATDEEEAAATAAEVSTANGVDSKFLTITKRVLPGYGGQKPTRLIKRPGTSRFKQRVQKSRQRPKSAYNKPNVAK